jgi:hypothetical protein
MSKVKEKEEEMIEGWGCNSWAEENIIKDMKEYKQLIREEVIDECSMKAMEYREEDIFDTPLTIYNKLQELKNK